MSLLSGLNHIFCFLEELFFQKSISKINFKNQFQKSISKVKFKSQIQKSISKIKFKNQIQKSISKIKFKNQIQKSISKIKFKNQIQKSISKINFKNQIQKSISKDNFKRQFQKSNSVTVFRQQFSSFGSPLLRRGVGGEDFFDSNFQVSAPLSFGQGLGVRIFFLQYLPCIASLFLRTAAAEIIHHQIHKFTITLHAVFLLIHF